jgi:hypothetical protein
MTGFRTRSFAVGVALIGALSGGCDEALDTVAGPTPGLTPTFSSIQRDILQSSDSTGRPSCVSCHNPGNRFVFRQVGMDLSADGGYEALVGVASTERPGVLRVAPGDPANSYLVQKIEGAAGISGTRMPNGGPYLTDGQVAIIKRWIELGAKKD